MFAGNMEHSVPGPTVIEGGIPCDDLVQDIVEVISRRDMKGISVPEAFMTIEERVVLDRLGNQQQPYGPRHCQGISRCVCTSRRGSTGADSVLIVLVVLEDEGASILCRGRQCLHYQSAVAAEDCRHGGVCAFH
jgi:hypothetical protein